MAPTPTVKKGNYVRRTPARPSAENNGPSTSTSSSTSTTKIINPSSKSHGTPADPNRIQFEQQEDFIGFDFSDGEEEVSSKDKRRESRGGKRKYDDATGADSEKQEEGTRQLRKREKERSTPWCDEPGVSWSSYDNATAQLNAEARAFINYISPTPVEHELRMWTIEIIRRTIKSKYADADVQCFGSVGTGLYLPGGDIDLVVLCPSMPSPPLKPSSSLLHRLASLLLTSSIAQPSSLVVIAKARVPIVKFTTRYGGFAVDLSVNQKNGVDAAVRVRGMLEDFAFREEGYVEPGGGGGISIKGKANGKGKGKETAVVDEEPIVTVDHGVARSLVLLVKAFLAQRGMNEVFTGGLGSYSIICLVISFLQLHPKIQSAQIQPSRNIGLLFVEFLEYYGKHFNFDEAGITLKGRGGYFNKHDKGWFRQNQPYLLSIEDPNDPSNDVSGGSHNIIRVRQTLAGGFDTLSATILQRQSLLSSQRNPSLIPLSSSSLPNADSDPPSSSTRSLLGSIIGMTRAGVEARDTNVRLWDDAVLQKILERIGASDYDGTGKKAMKRNMKEAKDREKRERTIAKLERRVKEKEEKAARKKEKKRSRKEREEDEQDESGVEKVVPIVERGAVEEAKSAAASLRGLAGGAPVEDEDDEEEEGSRYSLGVPAIKKKRTTHSPAPRRPVYTTHASDDEAGPDSSDDDDDDVVLGGGGGDFVTFDSQNHTEDESSGSDSSDQVMQTLVPTLRTAAKKTPQSQAPEPPKKKTKKDEKEKSDRLAYWTAKGQKE
ncbi:uncharacterized protein JCM6883_006225 [Sporobolomyces salmoneus]|uniref:uncharacterized protein n=1 Tax=Sporobolomyces salmoneus TaxID=183962 RepID=UPI00317196C4